MKAAMSLSARIRERKKFKKDEDVLAPDLDAADDKLDLDKEVGGPSPKEDEYEAPAPKEDALDEDQDPKKTKRMERLRSKLKAGK